MIKQKKFDALLWIRNIRDENSNKYENLSMKEFALKLVENAKKHPLWSTLNENEKTSFHK